MEAHDADLDFSGTLSALVPLLGRQVAVTTSDSEGKPIIVARLEGKLRRAADVSILERPDAETRFFYVTEEDSDERTIGFMIHAGCFGGGQSDEGERVRFLQGGVLVDVCVLAA